MLAFVVGMSWGRIWMMVGTGWVLGGFCLPVEAQFLDVDALYEERNLGPLGAAFDAGEYELCEKVCEVAIDRGLKSVIWRKVRARSLAALGREAEGMEVIAKALEVFPEDLDLCMIWHELAGLLGETEVQKLALEKVNELAKARAARDRTAEEWTALGRAALALGADPQKVIDGYFLVAQGKQEDYAPAYAAEGELALAKDDAKRAADVFRAGLKACGETAELRAGLARAFLDGDRGEAAEQASRVLALNPKHEGAHLLQAELAIGQEDFERAEQILDRVIQLRANSPIAWALRAAIQQIALADSRAGEKSRSEGLKRWPANPEVDHVIGRCLSRAYRFSEGARHQRRSLAFDETYLPARMALCHDLLRLGDEREAWELAAAIREADGYQVQAHNLGLLQREMAKFHTESADDFIVRMPKREWPIYGERALALLREAMAELAPKYGFQPSRPVLVEFFPSQQDFAIRTFGRLGGQGMLGACFGSVVTMNSPGSLAHGRSNWEATLWHEFCHVVTLSATKNRMPRWLSEGISVYEEGLRNPAWGMDLTATYREMILDEDGPTPVSELSAAFLNAESSDGLMFAYYESGQVVQFLVETYGAEALEEILADLAQGIRINDALAKRTEKLAKLEDRFEKHLVAEVRRFEGKADWSKPEPEQLNAADPDSLAEFLKKRPRNLWALRRDTSRLVEEERWPDILERGKQLEAWMPENSGPEGGLALQAMALRELKSEAEEREVLRRLVAAVPDDTASMLRLLELERKAEQWDGVVDVAERILALNPFLNRAWTAVADGAEQMNETRTAIHACERLLLLDDQQVVQTHFRLAKLLREADEPRAKRHLLDALAMAPRFREGLALLREWP